jgi:hypothetical protein
MTKKRRRRSSRHYPAHQPYQHPPECMDGWSAPATRAWLHVHDSRQHADDVQLPESQNVSVDESSMPRYGT